MKLYKITNIEEDEKIEITQEVLIFDNVNTHSGDEQSVILALSKEDIKSIKNLMCELSITDQDVEYVLKKNTTDDDSVYYYRTKTSKYISFNMYIKKDEEYIKLKPDANGVFYIEKNWSLNEDVVLKLDLKCEPYFSERFGENKVILLSLNFLGDINEEETFA